MFLFADGAAQCFPGARLKFFAADEHFWTGAFQSVSCFNLLRAHRRIKKPTHPTTKKPHLR